LAVPSLKNLAPRRCQNCTYVRKAEHGGLACNRYPPQAFVIVKNGEEFRSQIVPTVAPNFWCGEWKKNPDLM
jgi:hypothetical protein